jgi:hypothetical protein
VSGRDSRVLAPVHKHGGIRVLCVPGRVAVGRGLENMRGRGRVLGPGNATAAGSVRRPRHGMSEHVRLVQVLVTSPPGTTRPRVLGMSRTWTYAVQHARADLHVPTGVRKLSKTLTLTINQLVILNARALPLFLL